MIFADWNKEKPFFSFLNREVFWRNIMHNEFTAIIEKDGDWFIAYSPELPGANGQGKTIEECKKSLAEAILLILEERRRDSLRGLSEDAICDIIAVS